MPVHLHSPSKNNNTPWAYIRQHHISNIIRFSLLRKQSDPPRFETWNILLNSKGYAKISDFGVSASVNHSNDEKNTMIGTQVYMSYERINGNAHTHTCDIWSLGIIVLECCIGKLPIVMTKEQMCLHLVMRLRKWMWMCLIWECIHIMLKRL